jgi:hypothetical protein
MTGGFDLPLQGPWRQGDYARLLDYVGAHRTFWSPGPPSPGPTTEEVWLRHDVEIDLDSAHRMATTEATVGVKASYFFCPESPFMHDQADVRRHIDAIAALGHETFLHLVHNRFEPAAVTENRAAALALQFGLSDFTFNFHAPLVSDVSAFLQIERAALSYRLTASPAVRYHSDSGCRWRWGLPDCDAAEGFALQILTHPIWWSETKTLADCAEAAMRAGATLDELKLFLPKFFAAK